MPRKIKASRPATVCLLSPHALVLEELRQVVTAGGFRAVTVQLELQPGKAGEAPALPPAKLYVVDSHGPRRAVEVLVAGLRGGHPSAPIVLLAEALRDDAAFPFLRQGVRGLVRYADAREQLPRALAAVRGGGYWVPRQLLSSFVTSILEKPRAGKPAQAGSLSPREQQVVEFLLENLANKEIAARLGLSERTVKFHVSNVLAKHGVRRRADLILLNFHAAAVTR
jgi:two-component system nitrate/nitrite response regulator NarL